MNSNDLFPFDVRNSYVDVVNRYFLVTVKIYVKDHVNKTKVKLLRKR